MFGTGLGYLCHFNLKFETNMETEKLYLLTICQALSRIKVDK